MQSTLQEQLKKLPVQQNSILIDSRQKPSLLFDPKEAATKDRRTIYDLGFSGLQSLIEYNGLFKQFEKTLFDGSAIDLERCVEESYVNKILDKNIAKFLRTLAPYLLLRPAHLCLEWLIRRFHIHEYNREVFLAVILPYHETNIFTRILKTFRIRKGEYQWEWLKSVQKDGLPLLKSSIVNKAASDKRFYSLICKNTLKTLQQTGIRTNTLQLHINFYTSVIVGVLQKVDYVQEWHIVNLLPVLLKGLRSQVLELICASYVIIGQLITRSQISDKLRRAFIDGIANNIPELQKDSAMLLLILLFDCRKKTCLTFRNSTFLNLIKQEFLIETLDQLVMKHTRIGPLYLVLVTQTVSLIQENDENLECLTDFLERVLNKVILSNSECHEFVKSFLNYCDSYNKQISFENNVEQKFDIKDKNLCFFEVLKVIKCKYPKAFNEAMNDSIHLMKQDPNNCYNAVRRTLGFRLNTLDKDIKSYEGLYHYSASIRLETTIALLKNHSEYKLNAEDDALLKVCLVDRINDESPHVVSEILKLKISDFLEILGCNKFFIALCSLIDKIHQDYENWGFLTEQVLNFFLCPKIIDSYNANLLTLILMPILFPEVEAKYNIAAIKFILRSLQHKVPFLMELLPTDTIMKFEEYRSTFISKLRDKPLNLHLLSKSIQPDFVINILGYSGLTNFLILAAAGSKNKLSAKECLKCFDTVKTSCKRLNKDFISKVKVEKMVTRKHLSVALFKDFIISLVKHTNFEKLSNWNSTNESLQCFLYIMECVLLKALKQMSGHEWIKILKELLDTVFLDIKEGIHFLVNFYYFVDIPFGVDYKLLQVCAVKLMKLILNTAERSYLVSGDIIYKVMLGLSSKSEIVRKITLETLQSAIQSSYLDNYLKEFVQQIINTENEILMDPEQFPLILFTILNTSKTFKETSMPSRVLNEMLNILLDNEINENLVLKCQLLKVLKHINSESIVNRLLNLGNLTLRQTKIKDQLHVLEEPYSQIFQMIFERFTHDIVGNLLSECSKAWLFMKNVFLMHDIFIKDGEKWISLPSIALQFMDDRIFCNFPAKIKTDFIKTIIKTIAVSEDDGIFLDTNRLLKKCVIDCENLVDLLLLICSSDLTNRTCDRTKRKAQKREIGDKLNINTSTWKEVIVLMELLDNKRYLENAFQLLTPLFGILKTCLEVDENLNVEYVKQIILSLLLHSCKTAEDEGFDLRQHCPEVIFHVDYIVQCLRSSHNPQTHNNALLLLCHCAHIVPEQVLNEIVSIFTFMGSSVVRQEDAFSFHVINNIISSIIPIIVMNETNIANNLVTPVLKVFSDIILDVPEHRRLLLYTKLFQTLDCQQYFWKFLCILFEAHVVNDEKRNKRARDVSKQNNRQQINSKEKDNKRMEIALEITHCFEPNTVISTCIYMLSYIQKLPIEKDEVNSGNSKSGKNKIHFEESLFDINIRSAKELRHFRYIILQYISNISSSDLFLRKVSTMSTTETEPMKGLYQNFIIKVLSFIPIANSAFEKSKDQSQKKFWKVVINNLYDILDNAISLLSPDMFILVVTGLMQHQLLCIRRKVIELLITKLQKQSDFFLQCDMSNFIDLLGVNLNKMLETNDMVSYDNEFQKIQQTILIAIKLLSKAFGVQFMEYFKNLLITLTRILKKRSKLPRVISANVVLTIIEISSNLRAHSLAQLPKFLPHLIDVLKEQSLFLEDHLPDNVCSSIIIGIQKLVESLPLFLGRFTIEVIEVLSTIYKQVQSIPNDSEDSKCIIMLQRIELIWNKISTLIPPRSLVLYCSKSYQTLLINKQYSEITLVLDLQKKCIHNSTNSDLIAVQSDLSTFFLKALEFRYDAKQWNMKNTRLISEVEKSIVDSFVSWALKMSESNFRVVYHKVYEWVFKENKTKEAALTYFILTYNISEALKTLFVLFASEFIGDAARLLDECNSSKAVLNLEEQDINLQLLTNVLATLTNIFMYDSKQFLSSSRFETLLLPIIDQFENELVIYNDDLIDKVTKCITQLAVTVSNDVLWKQLNYQILIKTRSNVPEIRIIAFKSIVEIAKKLGDDYSILLPETIPFIAELFEDENSRVEKYTRKSVQELENILGESLQKYL